jgi:4-hydroxy-4-methyl-2-oxoglutarate aldolase
VARSRKENTGKDRQETERIVGNDIVKLFEGLRVSDVRDGLDWIGLPNKGSVDRSIMPIAEGMKFCGPAFTVRSRVTQKQVPMITGDDYTEWARNYWYKEVQIQPWDSELTPGDIVVLESPDAGVGEIGSYNSLDMHIKGAAAIVTSGGARDHDECVAQGVPIFAQYRNQAMTQGRVEYEAYGIPVTIGGVQIKPGDIVVGDGDGVIAVPLEVAEQVATYARQENENDRRGRRALYEKAGLPLDDSVR